MNRSHSVMKGSGGRKVFMEKNRLNTISFYAQGVIFIKKNTVTYQASLSIIKTKNDH